MKRLLFGGIGVALLIIAAHATGQDDAEPIDAAAGPASGVDRGRYLVHHVAMCVQCHSPRDAQGGLRERQLLQGAPMPVESPFAGQEWAAYAPRLAGLPGWESGRIVTLLRTGRRPNGESPRPPMPRFQMTEQDARAVVAYLKSLE
ncbi:MAG: c-type cytochrome [Planctomycetaceae bacterium]